MQIKKQKLQDAFNRVLKYSLVMAVPAAFGLAALGNYFLVLLYGYDYLSATLPLYFLSALVFVGVIVSLLLSLFSVKEKPQEYLPLLAITTIINIILNYILILWLSNYSLVWAISGAAIATIASWTFYCALLYYKVKKVLKIKADLTTIIKPMIASVIMIIVVYLARAFFGDANLIKGIALVAIGIIAYSIALYLIKGVSKEDISLISQLVKSKIQPKK